MGEGFWYYQIIIQGGKGLMRPHYIQNVLKGVDQSVNPTHNSVKYNQKKVWLVDMYPPPFSVFFFLGFPLDHCEHLINNTMVNIFH